MLGEPGGPRVSNPFLKFPLEPLQASLAWGILKLIRYNPPELPQKSYLTYYPYYPYYLYYPYYPCVSQHPSVKVSWGARGV